jgi:hypothetical protein
MVSVVKLLLTGKYVGKRLLVDIFCYIKRRRLVLDRKLLNMQDIDGKADTGLEAVTLVSSNIIGLVD